jgi:tetratricopeptide (TPR) repeat protein
LARASESLGIIEREVGAPAASLAHFQAAVELYKRLYGPDAVHLGEEEDEDAIARADEEDGTHDADVSTMTSSSASFRNSLELSTLYTNLANAHGSLGHAVLKRRLLERALAIVQRRFLAEGGRLDADGVHDASAHLSAVKPHPSMLSILNNLSTCYSSGPDATTDDVTKAINMLEQCLRWNRALHGTGKRATEGGGGTVLPAAVATAPSEQTYLDEHHSVAPLLTNLANLHGRLGRAAHKVALLERALALVERQHGTRVHPEVTVVLTNLGTAYGNAATTAAAGADQVQAQIFLLKGMQTLQQALSLKTSLYGTPVHNEVALTLANLSVLYSQAGDVGQEMRSLQQAMQIYMAVLQKQAKAAAAQAGQASSVAAEPAAGGASAAPAGGLVTAPNALPSSASALAANPALVFVQQRLFRARARMQAQQLVVLARGQCSFAVSGTNRTTHAQWFKCLTCCPNPKSSLGVCVACKERCHQGHEVQQQEPTLFYCDCGEGVFPKPCFALKPKDEAADSVGGAASVSPQLGGL